MARLALPRALSKHPVSLVSVKSELTFPSILSETQASPPFTHAGTKGPGCALCLAKPTPASLSLTKPAGHADPGVGVTNECVGSPSSPICRLGLMQRCLRGCCDGQVSRGLSLSQ